ncbi:MAG TPA: hypothetical protein DEQ38_01595 [Elusimicrobia bacterium]|nr:hypothetical protein [Elusimicrobiota bacterium]
MNDKNGRNELNDFILQDASSDADKLKQNLELMSLFLKADTDQQAKRCETVRLKVEKGMIPANILKSRTSWKRAAVFCAVLIAAVSGTIFSVRSKHPADKPLSISPDSRSYYNFSRGPEMYRLTEAPAPDDRSFGNYPAIERRMWM